MGTLGLDRMASLNSVTDSMRLRLRGFSLCCSPGQGLICSSIDRHFLHKALIFGHKVSGPTALDVIHSVCSGVYSVCGGVYSVCGGVYSVCGGVYSVCGGVYSVCGGVYSVCGGVYSVCGGVCSVCGGVYSVCGGVYSVCGAVYGEYIALPARPVVAHLFVDKR